MTKTKIDWIDAPTHAGLHVRALYDTERDEYHFRTEDVVRQSSYLALKWGKSTVPVTVENAPHDKWAGPLETPTA